MASTTLDGLSGDQTRILRIVVAAEQAIRDAGPADFDQHFKRARRNELLDTLVSRGLIVPSDKAGRYRPTDAGRGALYAIEERAREAARPENVLARSVGWFVEHAEDAALAYERAAESFRQEIGRAMFKGRSFERAIGSEGNDVIVREGEADVWETCRAFLVDGKAFYAASRRNEVEPAAGQAERLAQILELATAELLDVATGQRWEGGASNAIRRAAEAARVTGQARGWADVRNWAGICLEHYRLATGE